MNTIIKSSIAFSVPGYVGVILWALVWAYGCGGGSKATTAAADHAANTSQSSGDEDPNQPASVSADRPAQPKNDATPTAPKESTGGPESITGSSSLNNTGDPLPERPKMRSGAKSLYDEGYRLVDKGKYAEAQTKFASALREDPRAYPAVYALAVLADRQGQEGKALELYSEALRLQPDYELAAQGVLTVYVRRGQAAEAVRVLEPLAKKWQRNLALQSVYANALLAADREDEAIEHAKAVLRRDERYTPAMMALAKANLKKGRVELAQSIIGQVLKINDKNSEAHYYNGTLLKADQRLAEAMAEFRKAVEIRPDYAEARMALGVQLLSGGNYPEAVENLEICARLVPNSVPVYLNLGDAYRASKRWVDAKKSFDKALQLEPKLAEAHFNLGLLYQEAQENYPGMDKMAALNAAIAEFNAYRELKGPKISKHDPSADYLADLARGIEREKKRIEKEKARKEREAARAAKEAARAAKQAQAKPEGAGTEGAKPDGTKPEAGKSEASKSGATTNADANKPGATPPASAQGAKPSETTKPVDATKPTEARKPGEVSKPAEPSKPEPTIKDKK